MKSRIRVFFILCLLFAGTNLLKSQCNIVDTSLNLFSSKKYFELLKLLNDSNNKFNSEIKSHDCRINFILSISYIRTNQDSLAKLYLQKYLYSVSSKSCVELVNCKSRNIKIWNAAVLRGSSENITAFLLLSELYYKQDSCHLALKYLKKADSFISYDCGSALVAKKNKLAILYANYHLCLNNNDLALAYLLKYLINYKNGESEEMIKKTVEVLLKTYTIEQILLEYKKAFSKIILVVEKHKDYKIEKYKTIFFGKEMYLYNNQELVTGNLTTPKINIIRKYYFENSFYKHILFINK